MTHFDIVPVDPSDPSLVESWLAAQEAVHEHDFQGLRPFNPHQVLVGLVVHDPDSRREHWAAVCDGQVLGYLGIALHDRDNTHLAGFQLGVHPASRRRGIGSALLRHAEERALEDGRTSLTSWVDLPSEHSPDVRGDGGPFLIAKGYQRSLEGALRVCELAAVDDDALDRLWDESWKRAEGFELTVYHGVPNQRIIEGVAYLHARMYTDMPRGDWDLQEAAITADTVRAWERQRLQRGVLNIQAAVIHKESGDVAGLTEIHVQAGDERHCLQGDTIVDPRYRGHRLGTILKIANQRRLCSMRPWMRYVWTGNAVANTHMIAINESVGYRLAGANAVFQKKLGSPSA
ncbi:GNAT family N-acetyltransferase [Glycomyces albidus]|jgi:GNAT superfamily N-acetyltransferase|uniref:GNAT family N-acetyltransferase n=1 Tax=Glycomyces albidus TaxID=2656774 RepID=A0A6L5GG49_9ACTN|nr:GNAT family N-acetyltransferase [Glycomyces albidus]MQM28363.1 GNAT family N-acetyltransferase [Glycomyces albidus]